MKKKNKLVYLSIIIISAISITLFTLLLQDSQNNLTLKIKSKIPKNVRYFIKSSINFYLNNTSIKLKYVSKKKTETSKGRKITIQEYNNKFLDYQGPRAYLSKTNEKIFLITGTGIISLANKKNFYQEKNFKFKVLKSNIKKLITFKDFYRNSNYGIKGMMIDDKNIYVSLSNIEDKDCVKITVLKAKIDYEKLNFSYAFNPKQCVKKDNIYGEFQPIQSGGSLFNFDNENFLLSTGEFRFRDLAQNDLSIYGKILKINKLNGSYKIISKGHRNIQGLFFDKKEKIIISTEHGPFGGDEINVNKSLDKFLNFGWPVSSYGEHYSGMAPKDAYEKAPLYKSHSNYGFIEPIKYFVPSIGITQIVKSPKIKKNDFSHNFFFSSMGYQDRENSLSIHNIRLDKNYQRVIFEDKIKINFRVRDLLFLDENNILAYLEKKGSLIKIKINE